MIIPPLLEKNLPNLRELSDGFKMGKLSVRGYLDRLERLFVEQEPWVKAFVQEIPDLFEHLHKELAALESRFPVPHSRPPLYGIPVGVKDIFHVEGFSTCAGSRVPPDVLKGPEAKVVSDLKFAGALILGKTVAAEFACFAPGPTRNPYNLEHTPGGSSSGSAAAVAAGLCPLALGTQTGGSLLRPAAFCGIVGFKPSYGRISMHGVIPLAPSVDHVGFFTTDVEGTILVASILCEDWTLVTEEKSLLFGVPEGTYLEKTSEEGLTHFRQTCDRLSDAGFEILHIEMFRNFDEVIENHKKLVAAEAALVHRRWFHEFSDIYHETTAKIIREGQTVESDILERYREGCGRLRNEILEVMEYHHISALLSPAAVGPAPRGLRNTGDPVMNVIWTYAGLPAISIPCGFSKEKLPMGLQVVGHWMADEMLLHVAQEVAEFFG